MKSHDHTDRKVTLQNIENNKNSILNLIQRRELKTLIEIILLHKYPVRSIFLSDNGQMFYTVLDSGLSLLQKRSGDNGCSVKRLF